MRPDRGLSLWTSATKGDSREIGGIRVPGDYVGGNITAELSRNTVEFVNIFSVPQIDRDLGEIRKRRSVGRQCSFKFGVNRPRLVRDGLPDGVSLFVDWGQSRNKQKAGAGETIGQTM